MPRRPSGPAPSTVARLKSLLPTHAYLHLLHQGVMTGFLPRFTPEGKPTTEYDNLSPSDRAALARYLIDKVVPDAPKELALTTHIAPDDVSPANVVHLSSEDLRRIASTDPEAELPDVNSSILEAPALQPTEADLAGAGAAGAGAA